MNRAARRAAAARMQGRRTGYLHRILAARTSGAMPIHGVHHVAVEHVRGCAIFSGQGCSCTPNLTVAGPNGVIVIDEHGIGRKMAKQ